MPSDADFSRIHKLMEIERLYEELQERHGFENIIGNSPAIEQVLRKIDLVSPTDATVLITGETGTGKALIANAIHKDSGRGRRPLIHFKCGSVASEAIEAELFGQIRGAFSLARVRGCTGKTR